MKINLSRDQWIALGLLLPTVAVGTFITAIIIRILQAPSIPIGTKLLIILFAF